MPDKNLLADAEQYFKREIARFRSEILKKREDIGQTIFEIRELKRRNYRWWWQRVYKKIAVHFGFSYIGDLKKRIHNDYTFLDDCHVALASLQQDNYGPVVDVLKKLNKYWRTYLRNNLGINNETLATVVIICPPLARSLMPETLWSLGQVIRQELKLQCLN